MSILQNFTHSNTIIQLIDLSIVFIIVFSFLFYIKRSGNMNFMKVIFMVIAIFVLSEVLGLKTVNWFLGNFSTILFMFILIIFQPELRKSFERVRHGQFLGGSHLSQLQNPVIIKHILTAVESLSKQKIGALIAFEMGSSLDEYTDSGVQVKGHLSSELLINLFWPGTPTHDGAIIIRGKEVLAAGCMLPINEIAVQDQRLGTRHMAAMCLSEMTDAVIIVVSEETGTISLAEGGTISRYLTRESLETHLFSLYTDKEVVDEPKGLFNT